jgi:hypothetical protein
LLLPPLNPEGQNPKFDISLNHYSPPSVLKGRYITVEVAKMKTVIILIVIFVLALAGVALFVYSGVYNVAASEPHWDITVWFLNKVRERSIEVRSKGIQLPSFEGKRFLDIGIRHYDAICRVCHGAPGYAQSEIAQGLYPEPPNLASRSIQRSGDAELYWIMKNGIKMTGMPAFGLTNGEEELLGLLSFVRRIPGLKREDYDAMLKSAVPHGEKKN